MRYKKIEKTDIDASVIALGAWALGGATEGSDSWGKIDDRDAVRVIQTAMDYGINIIDTSPSYALGHSEELIGQAIQGKRDQVTIISKCGTFKDKEGLPYRDLSPKAIRGQLEGSLRRLGVETLDIYMIHWPDPQTPLTVSLEALSQLKAEGKFRYLAVSNFTKELIEEAQSMMDIVCLEPQFSLLERKNESLIQYAGENRIGVVTYGSLGAGILSGKYTQRPAFGNKDIRDRFYKTFFQEPMFSKSLLLVDVLREIAEQHGCPVSQVAINWVAQHPYVTSAIVGAKTPEQVTENARSGEWELSQAEIQKIEDAYHRVFVTDHSEEEDV